MAPDGATLALTLLALIAFAANSLLARFALGGHEAGAAAFTALRLASGAAMLALVVRARAGSWTPMRGRGVTGPLALFAYAAPFSFAYLRIGAAVGALVLFGAVQLTMIGYGVARGERPSPLAWTGVALAVAGFAALTLPGAGSAVDPAGFLLMTIAGAAWGVYSLAGRQAADPLAANARGFLWSMPLALLLLAGSHGTHTSTRGVLLAVISGAVTSGLGYVIWYRVLPRLAVTQASVAQLSVPVIAALGAVSLLGEAITLHFALCSLAILGGIALVLAARTR
jgi:drug/metabolite transporter (DMT)-like permease